MKLLLVILLLASLLLFAYHYDSPERVAAVIEHYLTPTALPNE